MRCWIAGFLLFFAQLAGAKTRMFVEDPDDVVAGRYVLTAQPETQAKETAESLLNSIPERLNCYGRFDDCVAVYLGGASGFSKDGYQK
jgi:hypothetical protein